MTWGVQEDVIWCFLYSVNSIIRSDVPHFPLKGTSLTSIAFPSKTKEAMYIYEVLIDK